MTVTLSSFRVSYPEFLNTADALCEAKIAAAVLRTSEDIFGDNTDEAVMLLAAHLLSVSPQGESARLEVDEKQTVYGLELRTLRREVTFGAGRLI